ncbi:MAG: hypothetical protein ACLFUH_10935 [Bacteroidales bacterium]
MRIFITLVLVVSSFNLLAQKKDTCNQDVWVENLAKKIPENVCIPTGYHITQVYDPVDLNGDGLKDFVFEWNKKILKNGDTIFVSIYSQNRDSTFSFLKTFNNLHPIYFEPDQKPENLENQKLSKILNAYRGIDPFRKLTFKRNVIKVKFYDNTAGMRGGLILTFKYREEKKDWLLEKKENWLILREEEIKDLPINKNYSIDNFDYLDYME